MGYIDSESLVKKASFLRIQAQSLAEGMKNGNFRSLYRGQGVEFSGVRDYIRGDDVRSIDWNVTARMGRPYVKIFEEDRELQIFIVMDTSASMFVDCGSRYPVKYQAAANLAALVVLAAEMNGCPVGAVFFDGKIHFSCVPQSGKERTMLLLTHLDKLPKQRVNGSVLGNALIGASNILRKRSLVFVISDFRSAGWETPLIQLAQKNDVIALRLMDEFDRMLPSLGSVTFKDLESDIKMVLPTSSVHFREEWKNRSEAIAWRWRETCLKHGIMAQLLNVSDDPLQVLTHIFGEKK
ncbi:MAG: DUF58 domain-containing protein [Treponema sp.]|nr:DUF58 domain-containing protein [Treponema sp.]